MLSIPAIGFKYPFGEESCEHEIEVLQDQYRNYYYFDNVRFVRIG